MLLRTTENWTSVVESTLKGRGCQRSDAGAVGKGRLARLCKTTGTEQTSEGDPAFGEGSPSREHLHFPEQTAKMLGI